MLRKGLTLATLLAATPLRAAEPMTAAEFEHYAQGKTLYYQSRGIPYGIERYMPGRRVLWAFLDEECKSGHWYEDAGQICFVYEDDPDPQCWLFFDTAEGLKAQFLGDSESDPLIGVEQSPEPMFCPGPEVGV